MWPFKAEKRPSNSEIRRNQIKEFKAFCPLGGTFNYLGRTCIVTGHSEWYPHIGFVPELHCDYASDSGTIHSLQFNYVELAGLKAQNVKA
jgi:hypothetical protein